MKLELTASALLLLGNVQGWPGMKPKGAADDSYIGPACTVGAHNWHPESGPCPNMEQPPAPMPSSNKTHVWPNQFMVDWEFYFVPDDSDVPPYNPLPTTPYNRTTGRTFYYNNPDTGVRNMKEEYDEYCIPVFGNPLTQMGRENAYSCDFLNVGETNTSYVLLHEDRPEHAPECCIIGRPFHAPPPDFAKLMPVAWTEPVGEVSVDWSAVYDNYGFETDSESIPYAFYMKGVPWIANWMWQRFSNFRAELPPEEVWTIPSACRTAVACPGWKPQ